MEPIIRFGIFTDVQYADKQNSHKRYYRMSKNKLKQCIDFFNLQKLDFAINLGDIIDEGFENYDTILNLLKNLKIKLYHVLGNHDYSINDELKSKIPSIFGMKSLYYSFNIKKWRFIILDGNELSFYKYPKDSEEYKVSKKYYNNNHLKSPFWNGGIDNVQINWFKKQLKSAEEVDEKVIILCHFPIYPKNIHNLWNAKQIFSIVKKTECIKLFLSGHDHGGKFGKKHNIYFTTMMGMVDTDENSYAIVEIYENKIDIKGFGREKNRKLLF